MERQWLEAGAGALVAVALAVAGFWKRSPQFPQALAEAEPKLPPELEPQPMGVGVSSIPRYLRGRASVVSSDPILFIPKAASSESLVWLRLYPLPPQKILEGERVESWAKSLGFILAEPGYWLYGGKPLQIGSEEVTLRMGHLLEQGYWPKWPGGEGGAKTIPGLVLFASTAHILLEEEREDLMELLMQWASRWSRGLGLSVWSASGQAWAPPERLNNMVDSLALSSLWGAMAEAGWVHPLRLKAEAPEAIDDKESKPDEPLSESAPSGPGGERPQALAKAQS